MDKKIIVWYYHQLGEQNDYAAYSVSKFIVEKVIQYIENQKKHHQKLPFQ